MNELKNKKNLINIAVIIILIAGLGIGIYLVKNQQILRGRALGSPPVEFIGPANVLTTLSGGRIGLKVTEGQPAVVELRLTTPFGPAGSGSTQPTQTQPTSTPAPTSTQPTQTQPTQAQPTSTPAPTSAQPTPTVQPPAPTTISCPVSTNRGAATTTLSGACHINIEGAPSQLSANQCYNFTIQEAQSINCAAGSPGQPGSCRWIAAQIIEQVINGQVQQVTANAQIVGSSSISLSWAPPASGNEYKIQFLYFRVDGTPGFSCEKIFTTN